MSPFSTVLARLPFASKSRIGEELWCDGHRIALPALSKVRSLHMGSGRLARCPLPRAHDVALIGRGGVNFQVTVLKILVSYPDGFAVMEDLKRDMAILATSGREFRGPDQAPRGAGCPISRVGRTRQRRMAGHVQGTGSARVHESQVFRAANPDGMVRSSSCRPKSARQNLSPSQAWPKPTPAAPLCGMCPGARQSIPTLLLRLLSGKSRNFPECLELAATGFVSGE
jgi:hypothetical protein